MEPQIMQKFPHLSEYGATNEPSVIDHLCAAPPLESGDVSSPSSMDGDDAPDVDLENEFDGTWMPDLTLRFPPTFSDKDLIFGIDGGILYNGKPAPVPRSKFDHLSVRDQVEMFIFVFDFK